LTGTPLGGLQRCSDSLAKFEDAALQRRERNKKGSIRMKRRGKEGRKRKLKGEESTPEINYWLRPLLAIA